MPYNVLLSKSAQKQLRKLPANIADLIEQRLLGLEENPRPPGCKKLVGEENAWRIRIGDYRVLYEIQDQVLIVRVVDIDHRKDVYKKR
ncbi:MAG TPA: type II toxin-antitoxin system RelE/ParE family toxin [Saprospiraceae bacterium]|nr:type II toxin-antitoxin system RelE/ParE family toxin [Saprospiraceae bacterium]